MQGMTVRNVLLCGIIAILLFFLWELYFHPDEPVKLTVGDLAVPVWHLLAGTLAIALAVKTYFVLRK